MPSETVTAERHMKPLLSSSSTEKKPGDQGGPLYSLMDRQTSPGPHECTWGGIPGPILPVTRLVNLYFWFKSHLPSCLRLVLKVIFWFFFCHFFVLLPKLFNLRNLGREETFWLWRSLKDSSMCPEIRSHVKLFCYCTININYYPVEVYDCSFGSKGTLDLKICDVKNFSFNLNGAQEDVHYV